MGTFHGNKDPLNSLVLVRLVFTAALILLHNLVDTYQKQDRKLRNSREQMQAMDQKQNGEQWSGHVPKQDGEPYPSHGLGGIWFHAKSQSY